jgi:protein-S-isoprenylcysteine O-methyltransferase Ste14
MPAELKSSEIPSPASSFGTRSGRVWFAIQGAIALALLVAPVFSRAHWSPVLRNLGLVIAVLAVLLLVWSYRVLGSSHSPWTTPLEGAALVISGPYRIVRHPVYAAYLLIGLGFEVMLASPVGLIVVAVGFLYYDRRTHEEERWLITKYSGYAGYRERVPGRLLPRLRK